MVQKDTRPPYGLFTPEQAARHLGIGCPRIYQLIAEGRFPHILSFNRFYLIPEEDVLAMEGRKPGWKKGRKRGERKKGR